MKENKKEKVENINKDKVVKSRPKTKKRKNINLNKEVPCKSVSDGVVGYVSKRTGMEFIWENYGDEHWLEVSELIYMKSTSSMFFTKPLILVDDEETAEYLGLTSMYNVLSLIEDIEEFYSKDIEEIRAILQKTPKGFLETINTKTIELINEGKLFDTRIINMLQKDFNMVIE